MATEWEVIVEEGVTPDVTTNSETFFDGISAGAAFNTLLDFWTDESRLGPVAVTLKLERFDGQNRTQEKFARIRYH